jgi:hypothetical protein
VIKKGQEKGISRTKRTGRKGQIDDRIEGRKEDIQGDR